VRAIFMGSPDFALPSFRALLEVGHDVALVVSQPDRPAGRSRRLTPPPVASFAREVGLQLYQPLRLRDAAAQEPLRSVNPDVIVVAAFGLLLPKAILDLPPHGCLNVHPSLLPRYRGASPIQAVLLRGETETGVSIIRLTEKLDAGPIVAQTRTPILPDEDAPGLESRLADMGARLLVNSLEPWVSGALVAEPQDETQASYCPRLSREDAELDWTQPAVDLARQVRAFRGRTDSFTYWNGGVLKILEAAEGAEALPRDDPGIVFLSRGPGGGRPPLVSTGKGGLELRKVALEGRRPASGPAILNGYPGLVGARLGRPT